MRRQALAPKSSSSRQFSLKRSPRRSIDWKRPPSPRSWKHVASHVHSERIFLVGCGEGAAVAYWLGLTFPERFAGVVAINGWLPVGLRPLGGLKACRDLSVLVVHGAWNAKVPLHDAHKDVDTLRAGSLRVAFQSYPCSHRLTNPMLADVDGWLIGHCTANPHMKYEE